MPVINPPQAVSTTGARRSWSVRGSAFAVAVVLPGVVFLPVSWGQPEPAWRAIQARVPPRLVVNEQRATAAGLEPIAGKHLTVYTDLRQRADVADLPKAFDAAVPQLARYFRVNPAVVADWHLTACVMLDRQRFVDAGLYPEDLPDFLAGYQRDSQLWVYPQDGEYYTRHLVLHEGVHAFMTHFLGGVGPAWYCEGIAEFVALHRRDAGDLQLPYDPRTRDEVPYWGRVRLLREAVRTGRIRSLPEVFAIPAAEFRQVEAYAWAWAACKFLHEHPQTRDIFAALPDHVRLPPAEVQAWLDDQLRAGMTRLSIEWNIFVSEMDYGYDVAAMALRDAVEAADRSGAIELDSRFGWQRSPWRVTKGEPLTLVASGEFQIADDGQPWMAQPNGVTLEYHNGIPLGRLMASVFPEDDGNATSAVTPIEIGNGTTIQAPQSGVLWLRLNDSPAKLGDNRGSVRIVRTPIQQ